MNPINNYRFGSYALLAIGLINLRYQTGSDQNLPKSLVLILAGGLTFLITFIPAAKNFLLKSVSKLISTGLLIALIAYSFLI